MRRDSDRLEASRLLADRGWGKAPAYAAIEEGDPLDLASMEQAAEEFRAAILRLAPELEPNLATQLLPSRPSILSPTRPNAVSVQHSHHAPSVHCPAAPAVPFRPVTWEPIEQEIERNWIALRVSGVSLSSRDEAS